MEEGLEKTRLSDEEEDDPWEIEDVRLDGGGMVIEKGKWGTTCESSECGHSTPSLRDAYCLSACVFWPITV
jgi:hypothetical protein